ncbi:MAG: HAD-IIIA family hydrolase [Candidatus Aenigmarchaeota archaeon]|nr:HAD-IIIA family hydrolase [Candidatus Aenigmarchaeota archaeon]
MSSIKQAVILAGGLGTRLRPLTYDTPKPMVNVNDRPFLEYLIELLRDNDIKDIVLCLGYLPEKVMQHFGDGSKFGVKITYSIGDVSFDTGKRLKLVEPFLDKTFLLMYCDNYWPMQIEKMLDVYQTKKSSALITVYTNKYGITKNNVLVDDDGYVIKYDKNREDPGLNGVEIGFMIVDKSVLGMIGDENCNFEEKIFPLLAGTRMMASYKTDHRYYSISTQEKLKITEEFFKPQKIMFLDRDGIINKRPPKADYVKKWSEFTFMPDAIEALKILKDNDFKIIVVTNQPGISRGLMTKSDLDEIHENLHLHLERNNTSVDAIYTCQHGWDENCECRKPNAGLFFQAANDFNIDLTKAFMIGDDERDLEAGSKAGCKSFLVSDDNSLLKIVKSLISTNME